LPTNIAPFWSTSAIAAPCVEFFGGHPINIRPISGV
jgi:hypothetical protein